MLLMKNLNVSCDETEILKGFSLEVKPGEVHAIMGPNGAGKSTLAKAVAGHPAYTISSGQLDFMGSDMADLDPEERAAKGIFVGQQYPVEIPGVSNSQFLKAALNAQRNVQGFKGFSDEDFEKLLEEKLQLLNMDQSFMDRGVNEGFSGGEKKRNEILQMALLDPKLIILDETDSGLDIDAMRLVSQSINKIVTEEKALILITHYQRLLDYIRPDYVHVMMEGKIVETGGLELAARLEDRGYNAANQGNGRN